MKRIEFLFVFSFIALHSLWSQDKYILTGTIVSQRTENPVTQAEIAIVGFNNLVRTQENGSFKITTTKKEILLRISSPDYLPKQIPIIFTLDRLNLGTIMLEEDITSERTTNLITLTDNELTDDGIASNPSGLLQATRDLFLNRAAFDFGQAFFRVRGYDSQNGNITINGIKMNKFYDGRPQWNNWGGLNDVLRNQQYTNALAASDFTFGGILGNTNIDTRPSGLRPGTRFTVSASNRTYAGRYMATHNSGLLENGLAYTVSVSKRWAKEGYINGTLYDAYSAYVGGEYKINDKNSLQFTGILASNRRGRSSAITEEVFQLVGNRYNPYWGEQDNKTRNAREREISEPILMLNYRVEKDKFNLNTGVSYQFGTNKRSRLGYFNAPNPDPTYYRYLPSFYINSPIGANFTSANLAKEGFLNEPQIDWEEIYRSNERETAAYLLYDDVTDDQQFNFNLISNFDMLHNVQVDLGLNFSQLSSINYAKITDLLGAQFHNDLDAFSDTKNDIAGSVQKRRGDVFNYNYILDATNYSSFAQIRYSKTKWSAFMAGEYSNTSYQREGLFQNERYLDNSLGKSDRVHFSNYGIKGGATYKITERHVVNANAAQIFKAPVLQNVFINPRENNEVVINIQDEKIMTLDVNYHLKLPTLTGRLSAFYTRFQNITDINFFFVDTGVGSDFVQEVLTDLDKLHLGTELGLEYQLSSSVKMNFVAAIGKYVFASDPNVTINFDTAGREEDLINIDGNLSLGPAQIKDYKLAQGPQQAYALGFEYRDPKYWWIGATANYLVDNYVNISTITRTSSFYLDPETGNPFPDATAENVEELLKQNPLDNFYLLNLIGGKSWLKNGKYISVFASINNAFDVQFRTGGYEQSRNGNFGQLRDDNLSGTPSFAHKYWYGYGRTFFLNIAYSF